MDEIDDDSLLRFHMDFDRIIKDIQEKFKFNTLVELIDCIKTISENFDRAQDNKAERATKREMQKDLASLYINYWTLLYQKAYGMDPAFIDKHFQILSKMNLSLLNVGMWRGILMVLDGKDKNLDYLRRIFHSEVAAAGQDSRYAYAKNILEKCNEQAQKMWEGGEERQHSDIAKILYQRLDEGQKQEVSQQRIRNSIKETARRFNKLRGVSDKK